MKYNARHRRSIRLKGYNYSQDGVYFVTICVQDRLHLFGEVKGPQMILNAAGSMVEYWLNRLESKFEDTACRERIIMPNHCHFIVENKSLHLPVASIIPTQHNGSPVGATPCGRTISPIHPNREPPNQNHPTLNLLAHENPGILGEHKSSSLRNVTGWFKTMVTNEYIRNVKSAGWPRFPQRLWQRNYYEHIIRDQKDYERIVLYMARNPGNWERDTLRH